ncbi:MULTISPECIES: hypothetical protein [unclassified Mesorhizobium]|uniref:hypothetical protein n=1 Tax=unclassified Mesorhizobium TaxID=325217 RepID=UPI000FCC1509|nr:MULTISPECIES: hypothetical protein [unclassified Mesorhizobium]RUT87644.1 hypothetical protein EOD14_09605 [Mesorhizobium sp. M7A.T.Ca.US.000.02.1.1]RUT87825.1 hypothetical protein EOD15_23005 [Mesorhizobium sp. M7A.T.Ca.US.000.02.2.1]
MYAIDKNVPIPPPASKRNQKWPYVSMSPGDSFLIPSAAIAKMGGMGKAQRRAHGAARGRDVRIALRATEAGLRVWRTA